MNRGDIRNGPYAGRAKEYSWQAMREVFGGNITPQDIDGTVEINRCFWYFEGKTDGCELTQGQTIYFRNLLLEHRIGGAVLVIGTHPLLDSVTHTQFTSVTLVWRAINGVTKRDMPRFPSMMWHCAEMFVKDARGGELHPAAWFDEWERMSAPFTEPEVA